jgi:hypothetical protein
MNETPLHFATKFGSYEVTKLLVSFDICNRKAANKLGLTPYEIICTKAVTESAKKNSDAIKSLFDNIFYVPLYRDEDRGDVVMEKPSVKLVQNMTATAGRNGSDSDLASRAPLAKTPNNFPLTNNQRKLAGFIGPISPTIVIFSPQPIILGV